MFDIGSTEFLLIIIVAVIVIGPKDLPRALYKVGQVVGKARAMSRHFRTGIDAMMREAELAELEKKWAAENKRIMEEHPAEDMAPVDAETPALPAPLAETPPAQDAGPDSAMPEYSRQTQALAKDEAKTLEPKTDEAPKDGAPA